MRPTHGVCGLITAGRSMMLEEVTVRDGTMSVRLTFWNDTGDVIGRSLARGASRRSVIVEEPQDGRSNLPENLPVSSPIR